MADCLFCRNPADSGEHLFPDWLNEVLPNYTETTFTLMSGDRHSQWTNADPAPNKLNVVCATCNSGWMANLEGKSRPVLEPMILGRKIELDEVRQQVVSTWTFLRAVIGEHLNPATLAIPQEHRDWLHIHGEPPMEAHVFVAATDARWTGDTFYKDMKLQMDYGPSLRPGESNGYVATIAIRHLALQIVGSRFKEAVFRHRPPLSDSLFRTWPFVSSTTWPTGPILTGDSLMALANHWQGGPPAPTPSPPTPNRAERRRQERGKS